jgi:hypothetical protein
MGNISSSKYETVNNGHVTRSTSFLSPPWNKYTRKESTLSGTTVTEVTRQEATWHGSETFYPLHVGPAQVTPIARLTLQSVAQTATSTDEMLSAMRDAPVWMKDDLSFAAHAYFDAHPPTRDDLVALKAIVPTDVYRSVATATLEKRLENADSHSSLE